MTKYDEVFRVASKEFWPNDFDWRWLKAQGIAESNLDHLALSPCKAMGVMQIMPGTWEEISKKIGVKDPWCPQSSIRAGVFYMRRLWTYWNARVHKGDENNLKLAQASYNAGMGNMRRAWVLADSDYWQDILDVLPQITGKDNAKQTTDYVQRIEEHYRALLT